MDELYICIYDEALDQTIIELLAKSQHSPQAISNKNFQSNNNYEQLLKIPIISLFDGVVSNHTQNI